MGQQTSLLSLVSYHSVKSLFVKSFWKGFGEKLFLEKVFPDNALFFGGYYETDFLISDDYKISPIEVKSSGYKTHASLDVFCDKYSDRIKNRYLIYTKDLAWEKGYDISKQHVDCGELIYNIAEKEYQGGSGAGCSATILNSYVLKKMKENIAEISFLEKKLFFFRKIWNKNKKLFHSFQKM